VSFFGDIALGSTIDTKFCTVTTTGAPTTLSGVPVISAYPDNSTTQLTAGITLTVDFDGVTGYNNIRVVATSGNGYLTATNYALTITTGTVGGTSVVGYTPADFSIENRSCLRPTVAARTLDVSATGEAGVDWANVGSPTTALALTNTTVATVTNLTNAPTAGDLTAAMKASVTTAATAATPVAASVTGNVGGNVVGSVGSVTAGVTLAASAVQAIWDALTSALTTVGSIGKLLVTNIDAAISSRLATAGYTAPLDAATTKAQVVAALTTDTYAEPAAVPSATSSLKDKIGYLFTAKRNKITQTATTQLLRNDADSGTIATSTVSDDGTTFIKGKDA
jgi:hypothetical protein